MRVTKVFVGLGEVGGEGDGLAVGRLRRFMLLLRVKTDAEVVMQRWGLPLLAKQVPQYALRFLRPTGADQGPAQGDAQAGALCAGGAVILDRVPAPGRPLALQQFPQGIE
jgi:hypothetical protein